MSLDQFQGCFLGLALGDALGAPFEGGIVERLVWVCIGTTRSGEMRWTDDTQMSIDVAESILAQGRIDADALARRFAASYRWSRGYGPAAARLLKRIARGADWREANRLTYPSGSFGNGAAMRAPVVGLTYANRLDELPQAARESAAVTHAHPLGIEGAVAVAFATALALKRAASRDILRQVADRCALEPFTSRLAIANEWLGSADSPSNNEVVKRLGNGVAASQSAVTAIYLALRYREQPFEEMLRFIASCHGDVDTIGAMAGAIWGTINGIDLLPTDALAKLEQRRRLTDLATALHEKVQ